jgi:hypothetical protein
LAQSCPTRAFKPDRLGTLLNECEELIAIIAKSIFTARRPKR